VSTPEPPDRPTQPTRPIAPPGAPTQPIPPVAPRDPVVEERVVERAAREPLIVEDLRALRRWLTLIGVLALIATGVAVWALVKVQQVDDRAADSDRVSALAAQVHVLERRVRRASQASDVARLDQRLAAKSDKVDVRALDRRLTRVEKSASSASRGGRDATTQVNTLQRRVDSLARELGRVSRRVP
jgi:hypothetical protein